MRYSDFEQRKMDANYGLRLDAITRKRTVQPCKNQGFTEVHPIDGSCLRCGASQGEVCQ